jgi:serine/threonine protein kinase
VAEVHVAMNVSSCPPPGGVDQLPPPPRRLRSGLFEEREGGKRAAAPQLPAPRIAGYEVLRELGRGGMGVVYLARQAGLDRLVAVKVMRWPHAGIEDVLRFRTEAAAAARLQHPNIVQIHEVGQQDGQPFLVLEYVGGGCLAQRMAGTPLAPPVAAQLVETLARAVHYAHERGIIHRDLKPSNVLLADGNEDASGGSAPWPAVKVTDFGLAKHVAAPDVSAAGLTATGAVLGTPSYMAPEQALGRVHEITPATDVYALGAILYETLTGRPPFRAATPLETMQQVLAHEPVPPGRLQPQAAGDLETICLKCLRKEPPGRYATALDMADDLRRHVAGEPIRARRAGPVERLWRWGRRNPKVAALVAALVAVFLSGFAGVFAQWRRAERQQAETAKNYALARKIVSDYFATLGDDPLLDHPGALLLRRDLLQTALTHFQDLRDQGDHDPELLVNLARACYCLGQLRFYAGAPKEARQSYEQAVALQEGLVRALPESVSLHRDLARTYEALGQIRYQSNEFAAAHEILDRSLAIRRRLLDADPADPNLHHDVALSLMRIGHAHHAANFWGRQRPDAARLKERSATEGIPLMQDARDRLTALVAEYPDNIAYQVSLGGTLNNLGLALDSLDRHEEALAAFRAAIERQTPLFANARHAARYRHLLSVLHFNLGRYALLPLGRPAEAAAAARAARKVNPQDPENLWRAARVLALAAAKLPPEDEELRRRCADEAMEALADAVHYGLVPGRPFNDLAPALRSREDYQKLRRNLYPERPAVKK